MINTDFDGGIKYHKRHMQIIPVSVSLCMCNFYDANCVIISDMQAIIGN